MNRPETLLHVVRGKEIGNAAKFVEEVIFEAEAGGRSDNGGFGVDITSHFLTPGLFLSASIVPAFRHQPCSQSIPT